MEKDATGAAREKISDQPARQSMAATGGMKSLGVKLGPLLFLVIIFLLNFAARIIFSPLLPTIEKELSISHGQAGFFFFLISFGYLAGLLGSGFVASRSTHKTTIVISSAGAGAALLGVAMADDLVLIRSGLVALGFFAGLYIPSAIATITALIDSRHWSKAIAVHELAPNLAFFVTPFIAQFFLNWLSWRAALGWLGAGSMAAGALFGRYGRGGGFAGAPASGAFKLLLRLPSFWIMLLLFALGISSTIGVYAMLPLYLVTERQVEPSWANTIVALSRVHGPVLGVLGGWVSDRLGIRRTLVVSLTFTGAVTFLLGAIADGGISAVVLLQPLVAVWFFPAGFAALALITPASARNIAVAFAVPFGFIVGAGAIPTWIGMMGDAGSFATGFATTGALISTGGALAALLKLPDRGR